MTETSPITVYEYLRPENTMEKKDYYLPADCVDIAKRLADMDIYVCCDIYPSGNCAVYLYDVLNEQYSDRLIGQTHATADVSIQVMLRHYAMTHVLD